MTGGNWKELYRAAQNGDMDIVRYHIESGVDPNFQHPEIMSTPLIAAISHGHTEVAEYLIANGADPDVVSLLDGVSAREIQAGSKRPAQSIVGQMVLRIKRHLKRLK